MKPYHKNPRQIKDKQFADLRAWLLELGDLSGIVHDLNSEEVISGNQRMRVIDIAKCEIVLVDGPHDPDAQGTVAHGYVLWQGAKYNYRQVRWDARQCEKANIIANKAGGGWDFDILANEWEKEDLLEWGFEEYELGTFPDEPVGDDPGGQVDKAEELREKWGVETGQLWQLGDHRLICGDCTDAAVVNAVAFGDRMDLWLTDAPYGVSYADKNKYLNAVAFGNRIQVPIEGDHLTLEDAANLWGRAAKIALEVCSDHAAYYWFACQGGDQMMMMMMRLSEAGWKVRHELIWVKNNHVLGRSDYNYKHEPILYGWKQDGKHKFYGGFQTSILEFPKPLNSDLHPTMKPVELIERLILNSTEAGHIVFDGFLGSGTTLIACERLGRRCRAIEISPAYCAVAIERWAVMTGGTPVLVDVNSGDTVDHAA